MVKSKDTINYNKKRLQPNTTLCMDTLRFSYVSYAKIMT